MLAKYANYTDEQFERMGRKKCLSLREASAYFGLGYTALEKFFERPDLDFTLKVGNRRYFFKDGLEEYLRRTRKI